MLCFANGLQSYLCTIYIPVVMEKFTNLYIFQVLYYIKQYYHEVYACMSIYHTKSGIFNMTDQNQNILARMHTSVSTLGDHIFGRFYLVPI